MRTLVPEPRNPGYPIWYSLVGLDQKELSLRLEQKIRDEVTMETAAQEAAKMIQLEVRDVIVTIATGVVTSSLC